MRRAAKVDANHGAIVQALRDVGACVQSLAAVGNGCPDLLVSFRGKNWLFEVKDGSQVPSKRQLTDAQKNWHMAWTGPLFVVESIRDALKALGVIKTKPRKPAEEAA